MCCIKLTPLTTKSRNGLFLQSFFKMNRPVKFDDQIDYHDRPSLKRVLFASAEMGKDV